MIEAISLCKRYGGFTAVDDLSIDTGPGKGTRIVARKWL